MRIIYIFLAIIVIIIFLGISGNSKSNYENVCDNAYRIYMDDLNFYKNISREQSKELAYRDVVWIPPENFISEIDDNCVLIITNGTKAENAFPIRLLDIEKQDISGIYSDYTENWNYWLRCKK